MSSWIFILLYYIYIYIKFYDSIYFGAKHPNFGHWELLQAASCTLWVSLFFLIASFSDTVRTNQAQLIFSLLSLIISHVSKMPFPSLPVRNLTLIIYSIFICSILGYPLGFPGSSDNKESACNAGYSASILQYSAYFMVQLSHLSLATGKTMACWLCQQSDMFAF